MASTGIALPIRFENGRVVRESGTAQLEKIIMLACLDEDSANPFQNLGLGGEVVFQLNDENLASRYAARIHDVFRRLEADGRARLADGYPKFTPDPITAELIASVKYIDLKTDINPDEFRFAIGSPFSGNR
jgi:hypothetical protein